MQVSILNCNQKTANKQLRWLCVSPYLFIALLTAGISLPVAVSLMNDSSIQTVPGKSQPYPSKKYSFTDLIQAFTSNLILNELLGIHSSFKHNPSVENYSNSALSRKPLDSRHVYYLNTNNQIQAKIAHYFSINFYQSGAISSFSSAQFSSHPRVIYFTVASWLTLLFSNNSQY
ncbi:hypothetical protein [Thorsellia kenyensis]|uniref:Uncharacterized protein n=1 Tax=Thorsellia kenyensis TaxID=1549888 RepID=A0ABV6CED5_9GAMM